ncbi:MAG: DUF3108 domain-containing protein [Betaproteobacteria bacterium]
MLSITLHALWSLWPAGNPPLPEAPALTATLKEMPPPPTVLAPKPPPARPVPQRPVPAPRHTPTIESRAPSSVTAPPPDDSAAADAQGTAPSAAQEGSTDSGAGTGVAEGAEAPATPPVALPPRVDLAYKVYLGTQGFMIGDATYRFEHDGDRYRIFTVGQARGLAALIVHGTGIVESRGLITPTGLKPIEFAIQRGSAERREIAYFDWDGQTVSLNDGETADLTAPAFDPLTILWQPYFSPPKEGTREMTFSIATTRKVTRYTLSREADERLPWAQGEIRTERWRRRSEDGKTEAWFWLAPSLHYIPVKMRVTRTSRGTLEARLDSIRVDEDYAGFHEDPAGAVPPAPPLVQPRSPFNDMTGS